MKIAAACVIALASFSLRAAADPPLPKPGTQIAPTVLPLTVLPPPPLPEGVAHAVLYEEDPNDPNGKRWLGSAIWRAESVSDGNGKPSELAVRADIDIPERQMSMTWTLRRATDLASASHTVDIAFKLPPDFPLGGIYNVAGVLMKASEDARGVALAGVAVKVTTGFFLMGLSNAPADQQQNVQLLKERGWLDIAFVYDNNRRAILALEKGAAGERAFAQAFADWGQ